MEKKTIARTHASAARTHVLAEYQNYEKDIKEATNMNVYAIYDNKVCAFATPFFARTNGEAIRMFARAANDENTDFNRWANDYCLFRIGSYDPDTGDLVAAGQNENLGLAIEYVEKRMTPAPVRPQND